MAKKARKRASTRGVINFNQTKADLGESVTNLKNALKKEGNALSVATRIKYQKSLLALEIAYKLVRKVECTGTFMTFEFRAPTGRVSQARAGRRR